MRKRAEDTEAERNVKERAREKGSGNGGENTNIYEFFIQLAMVLSTGVSNESIGTAQYNNDELICLSLFFIHFGYSNFS